MKKRYNILGVFAFSVLIGCHSHKGTNTHSHDENNNHFHSYETERISSKYNDYFGAYNLEDESFGAKTSVTLTSDKRIMVTNSLPDHKTGEFPRKGNPNTISAQNKTYSFPLNPKYTGESKWVREPGVALNGVKFEPGTAEVVKCDTGENYRVEAFQDVINLGLDFNHAHVQPTGAYHYHGTPTSVIENFDTSKDLIHIGFAHDGFPMYYSKSEAYKSSYKLIDGNRDGEDCTYSNPKNTVDISVDGHHDGTYSSDFEYVDGFGDLDECNGITVDGMYMYIVTSQFPYVSRCLMGEFIQEKRRGRLSSKHEERGKRPSIEQIFDHMDSNNDGKLSSKDVKGPFAKDFSRIDANKDGYLTKKEMENVVGKKSHG